MATFNFNGSESITTPFNATTDRVIFNLNAEDIVGITEDRGANVVTITAATGAVLTLTQTNFLALRAPGVLTPGNNSDIMFGIGTDGVDNPLNGNIVVGLEAGDNITGNTAQVGRPGGLLLGNQGADTLSNGNLFSVSMFGGQGNDTLNLTTLNGSDESLLVGGLGTDTINVNGAGVTPNSTAAYQGSVTIFGGNQANDPADGADTINVTLGASGEALIAGNGGDDTITIGALGVVGGHVTVFGGQGNDTINATVEGGQFIGGLGTDTINVTSTGVGGNAFTVIGGNDANDPADGRDIISVTLQDNDTALITGNGGNDQITLGGTEAAQVTVFGGQGNDVITGSVGDNSLIVGGVGNDVINITVRNEDPAAVGGATVGSNVTVIGGNGMADAADGADLITVALAGNIRASGIEGAAAQTATIFGNGGNDTIVLTGQGAASVNGGQGNDIIDINGNGLYTLTGGQGEDRFDFAGASGIAGINGGALNANTVVADVSRITDLNFDQDELALGNTIVFTATSTTVAPAGATLQSAATNAFNQATQQPGGPAAGADAAVIFTFQGQQFLVTGDVGTAGTPPAGTGTGTPATPAVIDALINITGFTGTIGVDDFVGA